jgi:hypothetical protein
MNRWPCCFIDGGASPASHVSRAGDCNSTARVGTLKGEYGGREALALSVRRWRWGVRPKRQRGTAQFRCSACGYGISMTGALPACPMCRKRAWERVPRRLFSDTPAKP